MELLLLNGVDVEEYLPLYLHSNMELLLQRQQYIKTNNIKKFTFQYGATST